MKIISPLVGILIALVVTTQTAHAQRTFAVDDFSDLYNAKVFISNTDEVFSPGWIAIFDKRTKRQLIKVTSAELSFDLEDGKLVSNIKEIPFGKQSLIMFEDYNFDGVKDLALMDGQKSCYHGPSYRVYLGGRSRFTFSPTFTRLAQEYCGMFSVDVEAKKINTMTKSGCCWHQFSEFVVENNRPVAVKIVEETMSQSGLAWDFTEKVRVGRRMQEKKYSLFNIGGLKDSIVFAFEFSNKKKMRLVSQYGVLRYVFTDKDDKVELIHSDAFVYMRREDALEFASGKTIYKIKPAGISVAGPGTNLQMDAAVGTISGSFDKLRDAKFENMIFQ
jgi:hypothetical protein